LTLNDFGAIITTSTTELRSSKMANTKYLGYLVRDLKTNEERFQIVDMDHMPPLMMPPKQFHSCIPTMMRKYVEMDRTLTSMEIIHFTNWTIGFTNMSKLKQSRSKLEVTVWGLPDAQAADELYALYRATKEQNSAKMIYEKIA
jgi:hypothetical protein